MQNVKNTKITLTVKMMSALKSEAAARGCTVETLVHDITMDFVSGK
jgi:hypothetical protein